MVLNEIYQYLTEREIERMENVIARFIHTRKGALVSQTSIYKMLAYVDNYFVVNDGNPLFLIEYKAMERGPVPIDIYDKLKSDEINTKYFGTYREGTRVCFKNKNQSFKFNDKLFSPFEQDLLKDLFEWLPIHMSTKDISDASHEDIASWRKAWSEKGVKANINDMLWIDTFDLTYNKKFKDVLEKLDSDELEYRKEQAIESQYIFQARRNIEVTP